MEDSIAEFEKGMMMLQDKPKTAIRYFNNAIRGNPEFVEAILARGTALLGINKVDDAMESFETVLGIDPDHTGAMCEKALILCSNKHDNNAAFNIINRAIGLGDPRAYAVRALIWAAEKEFEKTIEDADACLEVMPDENVAQMIKSIALKELEFAGEGNVSADDTIQENVESAHWFMLLHNAVDLVSDRKFGDALKLLEGNGVDFVAGESMRHNMRGHAYIGLFKYREAKQAFEESLRANPYFDESRSAYAFVLAMEGDMAGACRMIHDITKKIHVTDDTELACALGIIFSEFDDYQANACLRETVTDDYPFLPNILHATKTMSRHAAIRVCRSICDEYPENGDALAALQNARARKQVPEKTGTSTYLLAYDYTDHTDDKNGPFGFNSKCLTDFIEASDPVAAMRSGMKEMRKMYAEANRNIWDCYTFKTALFEAKNDREDIMQYDEKDALFVFDFVAEQAMPQCLPRISHDWTRLNEDGDICSNDGNPFKAVADDEDMDAVSDYCSICGISRMVYTNPKTPFFTTYGGQPSGWWDNDSNVERAMREYGKTDKALKNMLVGMFRYPDWNEKERDKIMELTHFRV